jgi:hypothetical protein
MHANIKGIYSRYSRKQKFIQDAQDTRKADGRRHHKDRTIVLQRKGMMGQKWQKVRLDNTIF